MARRSAWGFLIMLLYLFLFLNPALAIGKGGRHRKQQPTGQQPITPPPPPPAAVLPPPAAGGQLVKGHHGKKKNHTLQSPPTYGGMPSPPRPPISGELPALSRAVQDLVTKSLGLSSPPSTAPSPPASAVMPPAVAPAPEVSGSIALIVKSTKGKSFTDHICDLAAIPKQCEKILEGKDKAYINSLPAGTTSLLSIELSAAVASKAVLDMSDKMTNNNIDSSKTTCVENYQDAIVGFTGAYANFTADPPTAEQSLNAADVKIGLCESSLASGEPQCFLPQIDETNKLLRSLIQLVMKEFPQ